MAKKMNKRHAVRAAASYFASGLGTEAEVRAVALAGYHVGLTCSELGRGVLEAAEHAAALGCLVFVDSGAFAEVRFDEVAGCFVDKAPLTDADWKMRLDVYRRLALSIGRAAYVVAPDKVGDQQETLRRLARWASEVRALRTVHGDAEYGPRVIVPVQGGALAAADFAQLALEALGLNEDEVVWGIPSKKGATTTEQLGAFAATCQADGRFHLLGMGPQSPRYAEAVEAILEHCPDAVITCDAVRVTALVGRNPVRPLTAEQDAYRAQHPEAKSPEVKFHATRAVLGRESVALLLDNGHQLDSEADERALIEAQMAVG